MIRTLLILLLLNLPLFGDTESNTTIISQASEANQNISAVADSKEIEKKDEKFRLMFQVFSYASDLKNAWKVGSKALKYYPDSLYWHRKMAEVSQWLDKRSEATKHYNFVYQHTHDKRLEKLILDYALNAYQYETAAPILKAIAIADPTEVNINKVIDIYDKTGSPEKAAILLENLSQKDKDNKWARRALHIYMQLGDQSAAEQMIEKLEERGGYDLATGEVIADYYLSRRDITASYRALQKVAKNTLDKNAAEYYRQMSDMGWYLQKTKASALASSKLFDFGIAKLVDYERIISIFQGEKPELISRVALDGYKKFGKKYLYLTYLNTLFTQKRYDELVKAVSHNNNHSLRRDLDKDPNTWLMLAQAYGALGQDAEAINAFNQALILEPNNSEIESAILWYYIDHKLIVQMKEMIFDIEERGEIARSLWLPLAVGNFSLQRSDRAMIYIKRLMQSDTKSIDLKFMYAYLMQTREETGAFMMTMEHIYDRLDARRRDKPSLMQNPTFAEEYLKSGMYFIPVDEFEEALKKAKTVLSPKSYTEIAIFQTLRHNAQDRSRYLAGRLKEVEPWMQLSIALSSNDRADQQTLLYRYYTILPIRDRVTTALNTGNIALSQTLAFDGLEYNRRDFLLYQQMRDLTEKYSDTAVTEGGLQQRSELDRTWLNLSARYYLGSAWKVLADINLVHNRIQDFDTLVQVPEEESLFRIGLERQFMRGTFLLEGGIRAAMETYGFLEARAHLDVFSRFSVDAEAGIGILSDETTYLLLGGKKNEFNLKGSLQYLPSASLSLLLSAQRFYSQDDSFLGKGYRARLEWYHQVRNGYPDLAWGLFADYGWYDEEEGSAGVIDSIIYYEDTLILPETFYTVGANFYYGIANKQYYTRVWRPYASFSPYYNGLLKQVNFSFDTGVGGLIHDRDHLNIGISYDQSVNGTEESNMQIYIRYKHFF